MSHAHGIEGGIVAPDVGFKLPHKKTVAKIVAGVMAPVLVAGGITFGAYYDKLFKNNSNTDGNNVNPDQGINPITTEGTMSSQETVNPTVEASPSPTVATPEVKKSEAPDLMNYGLKYNVETEKYETIDSRYGIESKDACTIYRENVTLEGQKINSIGLLPEIAQSILKNELTQIPEGERKLKIMIPLDLSSLTESKLDLKFIKNTQYEVDFLSCFFKGNLTFVNIFPESSGFVTTSDVVTIDINKDNFNLLGFRTVGFANINGLNSSYKDLFFFGKNIWLYFPEETIGTNLSIVSTYGKEMFETKSPVILSGYDSVKKEGFSLEEKNLLTMDVGGEKHVVFIKPSRNIDKE